jgi:hypothetical protein
MTSIFDDVSWKTKAIGVRADNSLAPLSVLQEQLESRIASNTIPTDNPVGTKYSGSLTLDSGELVGTYVNTQLEDSGLETNNVNLYQNFNSSDYTSLFGDSENIFVGHDSDGNLWEMDSDTALEIGKRFASYHYLYDGVGTLSLQQSDTVDLTENHYWLQDVFIDVISPDSSVAYSIVRKSYDDTLPSISGNNPVQLINTPTDFGVKALGSTKSSQVVNRLRELAQEKTDIGKYLLIQEPTTPVDAPYNETGGWMKKGYALDTRKNLFGQDATLSVNKYWLWCRVTEKELGDFSFVDSDYYTPVGIDEGYVHP